MKRGFAFLLIFTCLFCCEEDYNLTFIERNKLYDDNAIIEINIPEAQGNSVLAKAINFKIEHHIANTLNYTRTNVDSITILEAIAKFDNEYLRFKSDFEESNLVWEATFDGEVMYQSSDIISIALSSYTNTGGAHGNSYITFYNFDTTNGKELELNQIINDIDTFTEIANTYFISKVNNNTSESIADYFYGKDFQLPENIGYNEEGLVLLYNTYEIASYAMGITEFTIPYSEIESLLLKH